MAKKGKKGKKSKKSSKPRTANQSIADKIPEFLLCIQIEGCKLSIAALRDEYTTVKEDMKRSREIYRRLLANAYDKVQDFLKDIDQLNAKSEEIGEVGNNIQKDIVKSKMAIARNHQLEVEKLQLKIEELELKCDKKNAELQSLLEFKAIPDSVLEGEIDAIRKKGEEMEEKYSAILEKLLRRHEAYVSNCHRRSEGIINAAEGVACQREIEKMSHASLGDIKYNRNLKKALKALREDCVDLEAKLKVLEKQNIELQAANVQVDWNMSYQKIEQEEQLRLPPIIDMQIPNDAKKLYKCSLKDTALEILNSECIKRIEDEQLCILGKVAKKTYAADTGPAKFYHPLVKKIVK